MCAVSGARVCSDCRGQGGERREGMARVEESLMASGARGAGLFVVSGVRDSSAQGGHQKLYASHCLT